MATSHLLVRIIICVTYFPLLICLENLRFPTYIFRGSFLSQDWLQLIAIVFCRQARIRVLDNQTCSFEKPITILEALSIAQDDGELWVFNTTTRQRSEQYDKEMTNHTAISQTKPPALGILCFYGYITSARHSSVMFSLRYSRMWTRGNFQAMTSTRQSFALRSTFACTLEQ